MMRSNTNTKRFKGNNYKSQTAKKLSKESNEKPCHRTAYLCQGINQTFLQ